MSEFPSHCDKCRQAKWLSRVFPKLEEKIEELTKERDELRLALIDRSEKYKLFIDSGLYETHSNLKIALEALKLVEQQDRSRGYPTGTEWMKLVKGVSEALERIGK